MKGKSYSLPVVLALLFIVLGATPLFALDHPWDGFKYNSDSTLANGNMNPDPDPNNSNGDGDGGNFISKAVDWIKKQFGIGNDSPKSSDKNHDHKVSNRQSNFDASIVKQKFKK